MRTIIDFWSHVFSPGAILIIITITFIGACLVRIISLMTQGGRPQHRSSYDWQRYLDTLAAAEKSAKEDGGEG